MYSVKAARSCSQKSAIPARWAEVKFSSLNTPARTAAGITASPKLRFQGGGLVADFVIQPFV